MKTVAVYVRVSTAEQNEQGQLDVISQWLRGNGIDLGTVKWFVDKGRSGDNLKRPAFEQLQQAVFMGEVGTVVCYKLDRLSRSLRDGINVLCDWCDRGLRVVVVTQQIDFNGTIGKMLASVLLGIAQMEQETRRERQQAGIAVAKREGKYKGRQKGTTKGSPERARELKAMGLSVKEIQEALGISQNTCYCYLRG